MKKIKLFGYFILALLFTTPCWAQMLDDEDFSGDASEYDTLFDEMYNNDDAKDKANTASSIEDVAKSISVKIANEKKQEISRTEEEKQLEPLDGDISIGVSKGSFKVFQDVIGRTTCTFGVTLKSSLNRDIRNISLRLMYQNRAFAFIYKNIKAGEAGEKYIITHGDICYNLSGVPNIDINRCRIFASREDECAKRIKWEAEIESPDPSKNPYL